MTWSASALKEKKIEAPKKEGDEAEGAEGEEKKV